MSQSGSIVSVSARLLETNVATKNRYHAGLMLSLRRTYRSSRHVLADAAGSGLNLVFPDVCPVCSRPHEGGELHTSLCDECARTLEIPSREMCPCCASLINRLTVREGRCPRCRGERLRFHRIICLGPYRGQLGKTIVTMKNVTEQHLAYAVGRLLGKRVAVELAEDLPHVLVPMPMHWRRRLRRGNNTSEVLAEAIGRTLATPVWTRALRTLRLTEKQSTLTPAERRRNVQGAFAPRHRFWMTTYRFDGQHVGLVDDAVTTGATANAAAKVLLAAGAGQVTVLAVARASR